MSLRFAAIAAALFASPVLAAEPLEAPVTTAAEGPSVAEQIDAYLRTSPILEVDAAEPSDGLLAGAEPDGRMHGEVGVAVGTGGYRSVYLRTEMPVGDTGRVSLAFQDTRGGRLYDRGLGFDRQRCDLEAMTPLRNLDSSFGGPHGRCVRPIPSW